MLSRNAQEGFQNILKTCALQSFRCTEGSPKITLANEITDVKQDQFIMLTIVSYSFRAILLIHFKFSSDIKDYVKKASFSDENPDDDACYDYLSELGNEFCGAIKRELGKHYSHLGMSTPNTLPNTTLNFLSSLDPTYETHSNVFISSDDIDFGYSLMVSSYEDMDFQAEKPAEEEIEDRKQWF